MNNNQPNVVYWKDVKKIDEEGFIQVEPKEKLYHQEEASIQLQQSFRKYQINGLEAHYISDRNFIKEKQKECQTIKYRSKACWGCVKKKFVDKQQTIGTVFIKYHIERIKRSDIICKFPFIIFFYITISRVDCNSCENTHHLKIYQNSLFAIRTQFLSEIKERITFMKNDPQTNFISQNFNQTQTHGDTIYEDAGEIQSDQAFYHERSSEKLLKYLRFICYAKNMDFEGMRFQQYAKLKKYSQKEIEEYFSTTCFKEPIYFKIQYQCRKCETWTFRQYVNLCYSIQKLQQLPVLNQGQMIYDDNKELFQSMFQKEKAKLYQDENQSEKVSILKYYNINRGDLDRSVKRDIMEFKEDQKLLDQLGRWHKNLEQYSHRYLILLHIQIPKRKCRICYREKDGLIYGSRLKVAMNKFQNLIQNIVLSSKKSENKKKRYVYKND